MKTVLRIAIPVAVIALAAFAVQTLFLNAPTAQRNPQARAQLPQVSAIALQPQQVTTRVAASGSVRAGEQTRIVAEVREKVVFISSSFVVGGSVRKGDVLVKLANQRYKAGYNIALADVTRARATLLEEQARGELAQKSWQRSNPGKKGSPLSLRQPQMDIAQANLRVAENKLTQAELDLAATVLRAPYDGVTISRNISAGEYVNAGSVLGAVMARNYHEITLAVSGRDLELLGIGKSDALALSAQVVATLGKREHVYSATIVRMASQVDESTRQFALIAQVDNPFDYQQPLYPGQFVRVHIDGEVLSNVFAIPLSTINQDNNVALVVDGMVRYRPVQIVFFETDTAIVDNLNAGDMLVTSSTATLEEGSKVRLNRK